MVPGSTTSVAGTTTDHQQWSNKQSCKLSFVGWAVLLIKHKEKYITSLLIKGWQIEGMPVLFIFIKIHDLYISFHPVT
jgi:hypothetical protein